MLNGQSRNLEKRRKMSFPRARWIGWIGWIGWISARTHRRTRKLREHVLIEMIQLLQGQGLQEAHPAQGHPVQGWQGTDNAHDESIRMHKQQKLIQFFFSFSRPLCSPRVSVVTTVSSPVTVVRPSLSSTRRQRPPRRLS